jgi:hypothetical protein
LAVVASVRRIAAESFKDIASPPGSSSDELMRNPLESLVMLLRRFSFV